MNQIKKINTLNNNIMNENATPKFTQTSKDILEPIKDIGDEIVEIFTDDFSRDDVAETLSFIKDEDIKDYSVSADKKNIWIYLKNGINIKVSREYYSSRWEIECISNEQGTYIFKDTIDKIERLMCITSISQNSIGEIIIEESSLPPGLTDEEKEAKIRASRGTFDEQIVKTLTFDSKGNLIRIEDEVLEQRITFQYTEDNKYWRIIKDENGNDISATLYNKADNYMTYEIDYSHNTKTFFSINDTSIAKRIDDNTGAIFYHYNGSPDKPIAIYEPQSDTTTYNIDFRTNFNKDDNYSNVSGKVTLNGKPSDSWVTTFCGGYEVEYGSKNWEIIKRYTNYS